MEMKMTIDIDALMKLIDKVSEAPISKFCIEEDKLKIKIEKNVGPVVPPVPDPVHLTQLLNAKQSFSVPVRSKPIETQVPVDEAKVEDEGTLITSPIVGIFYATPNPNAEPYVKVGDTVKKGQVVGIVEAMKLMNEIESEVDGVIAEILVDNQTGVEFGQPLFRVK